MGAGSGLLIDLGNPEKAGLWPYHHWRSSQNPSGPQVPHLYNGYPLTKYILSTRFMLDTAMGTRKVAVNKTDANPCPLELMSSRK